MVTRAALTAFLSCVVLLAPATVSGADPLGRLFTTAQQRAQMDELRSRAPPEEIRPEPSETPQVSQESIPSQAPSQPITVRGLVQRQGGQSTVWINDTNTYQGDPTSGYLQVDRARIGRNGVPVTVPGKGEEVVLKVGNTYLPDERRIVDVGEEPTTTEAAPAPASQGPPATDPGP